MDTGKELNYRLYIQREEAFVRTDIKREFSRYDDIKNGEVEKVKENFREIKKDFFINTQLMNIDCQFFCAYVAIVYIQTYILSQAAFSKRCIKAVNTGVPAV